MMQCLWKKIKALNGQRHIVFMDWKTQYSKGVNSPQTDTLVQCNLYRNPSKTFSRQREIILKFKWKHKGTRIANKILKKKNMGGSSLSN